MADLESTPKRPRSLSPEDHVMSFGDHLEELRKRVTWGILGLIPIFLVCAAFGDQLLNFLIHPLQAQLRARGLPPLLMATGPMETFASWVRVSVIVTILVGAPWILWQLWLFVAPGLHAHERRFVNLLIPFSALLTTLSGLFLYFVMLPVVLAFFIGFGSNLGVQEPTVAPLPPGVTLPQVPVLADDPPNPAPGSYWINSDLSELRFAVPDKPGPDGQPRIKVQAVPLGGASGIQQQYRVSEYIGMVFSMALAFAIGFQTPVVVLLLGWVGILRRETLVRYRKYAFFICAIAAAILTPTADPLTMSVMLIPLYALYELGVLLLRYLPAARVSRGFRRGTEPDSAGDE